MNQVMHFLLVTQRLSIVGLIPQDWLEHANLQLLLEVIILCVDNWQIFQDKHANLQLFYFKSFT